MTNMTLKANKRMTAPAFIPQVKAWISDNKKCVTEYTDANMGGIAKTEIISKFGFNLDDVSVEVISLKGTVEPDYTTVTAKGFECKYSVSGIVLVEVDTEEDDTDYLYRISYSCDHEHKIVGDVSVKLYRAITD